MARKPKEPSPNPSDIEYEVDKIVGHKFDDEDPVRVRYLYRIRWLNFTWKDDTWEPRESLEGGAEGILTEYQEERRKAGQVFFDEGAKKSKIPKYLAKYNVGPEVLTYDEGDGPEDEEVDQAAEDDEEEIEEAPVASKEKKRKQRESEAAAAVVAEPARSGSSKRSNDVNMEEDDRRTSNKKSRHTSQSPLPPPASVLRGRDERDRLKQEKADRERAEKAKEEERLVAKKPSSKRHDDEVSSQSQSKNKKRPSSAAVDMDSEDDAAAAKEIESLKRSPLKETKADQRHSADTTSRKSHTQEVKESLSSIPAQQQQPLLGSQIYAKDPSWEDLLFVESLEQGEGEAEEGGNEGGGGSNEYRWFIKWNDETLPDEWILNTLARIKFPQKLLTFYEDHLKFKSTPDEDDPVNGDDVAMY